ncbi:hypothetical protein TIFTF001_005678 [Ficus carica]|uniref:Uncharacterized protein n=1 Tax=Ficus carica TaxID=3494 RepID=A0AA87ZYS4_FICCA|nr:hypothetical protein TIFTF001_005678 [Ficus carica]
MEQDGDMNQDRVGIAIFSIDVATDLVVEITIGRRPGRTSPGRSRFRGVANDLVVEIVIRGGRDRCLRSRGCSYQSPRCCVRLFIAAEIARKIVSPCCNCEENRRKLRPSVM